MKDLVSIKSLSREQIIAVLNRAMEMKESSPGPILRGCVMASCFFEPSTRTRLSFEAACKRLGGEVIGFADQMNTSTAKGETLHDAMKVIGLYADVVVIRHPEVGSAAVAGAATDKPVINAGDGANEHPTQTLLDLMTMGPLDGLHIACAGDLLNGRTVHSLTYALKHFDVRLYFVAPPSLALPEEICQELKRAGIPYSFHKTLDEVIGRLDVLYMTRVQKERGSEEHGLMVTKELLKQAKKDLKVLHPLPRNGEIEPAVDETEHAHYFEQAKNGLYIRQALLCEALGK